MSENQSEIEATDIVGRMIDDLKCVEAAAERILWNLAEGTKQTANHRKVLKLAGIDGKYAVDRELGRIAAVKRWMAKSGSKADYITAKKAATAAALSAREKLPELETQLARIQSQIDELVGERERTASIAKELDDARAQLRNLQLMPIHIREALNQDEYATEAGPLGKRRAALRKELDELEALEELGPSEPHRVSKLAALEAELVEVVNRINDRIPDADELFDFYVNQIA